jgi:hypothetical protein
VLASTDDEIGSLVSILTSDQAIAGEMAGPRAARRKN